VWILTLLEHVKLAGLNLELFYHSVKLISVLLIFSTSYSFRNKCIETTNANDSMINEYEAVGGMRALRGKRPTPRASRKDTELFNSERWSSEGESIY
jgi:hypothetical protein